MTLPLYQEHKAPFTKPAEANTGLWYDKFCNQWCRNSEKRGLEAWTLETFKNKGDDKSTNPKQDWIDTVIGETCGNSNQLEQAVLRMTGLLEHHQQAPLYYRLESDFVTGLGRKHPVENGFAWHHTLGTPYLPGSSVKGMVRAWVEQWTDTSLEDIRRIFGPSSEDLKRNRDLKTNVGSVIFLDALPKKSVHLKADIMTPHYSDYYAGKKDKQGNLTPPSDWHTPIPIPFLVVEKDQTFVFGVLPRRSDEQGENDCATVKGWLKEALCWTGAGAKTAVGYGRFTPDETAQAEAEKEQMKREKEAKAKAEQQQREAELLRQTQGKSDLYIELFKQSIQNRWAEPAGKDSFVQMGVIEGWLEKLENDPQADAIQYLAELIRRHFTGLLENPDAVQGKKAKPVYSDRQKTIAKRLLYIQEKQTL